MQLKARSFAALFFKNRPPSGVIQTLFPAVASKHRDRASQSRVQNIDGAILFIFNLITLNAPYLVSYLNKFKRRSAILMKVSDSMI